MNSKKARAIRKAVRLMNPDLPKVKYKETGTHAKVMGFDTLLDGSKVPQMVQVSDPVELGNCQRAIIQEAKRVA